MQGHQGIFTFNFDSIKVSCVFGFHKKQIFFMGM